MAQSRIRLIDEAMAMVRKGGYDKFRDQIGGGPPPPRPAVHPRYASDLRSPLCARSPLPPGLARAAFLKAVTAEPSLLNARGPEGSTPFMCAVLYANPATIARLLKMGADPNKRNDANATALMWAARDLEKTRLLVEHGADVNAKSDDLRTPLMIAARRAGDLPIGKLLLDKGANPNPNAKAETEGSPLLEALLSGDAAMAELLVERGADAKATGETGLTMSVTSKCQRCLDLVAAKITDKGPFTASLQDAAVSDVLLLDVVKLLIERGADVNAKDKHTKSGDAVVTVLDIAKLNGQHDCAGKFEAAARQHHSLCGAEQLSALATLGCQVREGLGLHFLSQRQHGRHDGGLGAHA